MQLQQDLDFNNKEERLTGIVDHIIFSAANDEFSVFRLRLQSQSKCTATVNLPAPLLGQEVHLSGTWFVHPRFGRQFRAVQMHVSTPTTAHGIERFLSSGVIEGIGPAMARRIVERFGIDTLKVIESTPRRLTEVTGIGPKTAEKITASYLRQSELRDIMLWLEEHGVTGSYAARIFKKYGSLSLKVMETNPYQLAQEVDGIGFITADTIAAACGWEKNSTERIAAGILFELAQIASNGHCCIPEALLIEHTAKRLGVEHVDIMDVLRREVKMHRVYAVDEMGERLIYSPQLYHAEVETADLLRMLKHKAEPIHVHNPAALVSKWEEEHAVTLAQQQRDAVIASLLHGVVILTGGPGTGKTTVIRSMIDIMGKQGLEILDRKSVV